MSRRHQIPALPPRSGCRVCGAEGWELCEECAKDPAFTDRGIGSRRAKRAMLSHCKQCGREKNGWGTLELCTTCCTPGSEKPFNYKGFEADCDAENERLLKRLKMSGGSR